MAGRASAQAALETRTAVLRAAADLASVEGLESVTIGRLADLLEMSKSGVIGQFRSKERLQLATIELVLADFRARIWEPVRDLEPGLPRLTATLRRWVDYTADPGYPGGCFITQATFDFDSRSGPVHDVLAQSRADWRRVLRRDVEAAVAAGDLAPDTDTAQVVFGLESLAAGVTPATRLHGDPDAATWALRGMYALLGLDRRT